MHHFESPGTEDDEVDSSRSVQEVGVDAPAHIKGCVMRDERVLSQVAQFVDHGCTDVLPWPSPEMTARICSSASCTRSVVYRNVLRLRAARGDGRRVYFAFHKPRGVSSMRLEERNSRTGSGCVYHVLPDGYPHVPHVGRLDKQTTGLLLFTDDGALQHGLMDGHASAAKKVSKLYRVTVRGGMPDAAALALMREPVPGTSRGAVVTPRPDLAATVGGQVTTGSVLDVVIEEGKTHQVRILVARAGVKLTQLHRLRVGPVQLGDLPEGSARPLSDEELAQCYADIGAETPAPGCWPLPLPVAGRSEH